MSTIKKTYIILIITLLLLSGCTTTYNKEPDKIDYPDESEYHPIAIDGLLVGGSKGSKWINSDEILDYIEVNDIYMSVDEEYNIETCTINTIQKDDITGANYLVADNDINESKIYIKGQWIPTPRVPQKLSNNNDTYMDITKEVLNKHGLKTDKPVIKKIYRVDIEGDEVDEVIIEASYFKDDRLGMARKGNYSIIFMRKIVDNDVKTIELAADIYLEDKYDILEYKNSIVSLVDLNNDGVLEVIVKSQYYEGYGISVYEVHGSEIKCVLEAFDGV